MNKLAEQEALQQLVASIANSISSYCQKPCEARCCRVGELLLEKKEAEQFTKKTQREDNMFIVPLRLKGCEHLQSNASCGIYNARPNLCRDFPLFLKGNTLLVAGWCLAVKEGLIAPKLLILQEKYPEVKIVYI
ncbi:YkgJ family cysteine cluster protein [Candidatus Woesearchaeota archaeon]|nr:YkgJ family cysteine cluster protein [Candidatus Woesearchaeota archaeon]